ncbi:MAG: fluoride efflux transporter CrcB [Pseudomonadota bacterium]|nr:fluoride efflux transporter CrcB [Pseudomonadota bacterium]
MFLYVAMGGAVGASGRYAVSVFLLYLGVGQFPWGTFLVNVAGSFFMGVVSACLVHTWSPSPEMRAFLVIGILGGFTTFSAFSLDILSLAEKNRFDLAVLYLSGTLVLSVGGLFAGLRLMRVFLT